MTRRTPRVEWTAPDGRVWSVEVETRRDRWRLLLSCGGEPEVTPWAGWPGAHRMADAALLDAAVYAAERHMQGKGNGRGAGPRAVATVGGALAGLALEVTDV
jgi:hypothetical protein